MWAPYMSRVTVVCQICGIQQSILPGDCLRNGWPKCCGCTMRLSEGGGKEIIRRLRPTAKQGLENKGGKKL